jgi:protein-disulfide isomerase
VWRQKPELHQYLIQQPAQRLEFTGTPSWVVGDQIFNGAVGFDQLKDAIAAAREAKSAG